MEYREININGFPLLRKFVSYIYEIKTDNDSFTYRTIPNGKIGISLVLNGCANILRNNSWDNIPCATIYGLTKDTQLIKLSEKFKEIAIAFDPAFLQMFVNDSMSQFSLGKTIDLRLVFNKCDVDSLIERISLSRSDQDILLSIETFLFQQFLPKKENEALLLAIDMITKKNNYNVSDISNKINISSTTLRLLFRDFIGISPKDLIKINRITKVLNSQITHEQNLTQIANQVGYFDQSHFIRDFKSILDITPKEYFKNKNLTFDFYNYGRWTNNSFVAKKYQK